MRSKIGAQPLADLIERCCKPLAHIAIHPQAFYNGLRVVAVDGSNFELPGARGMRNRAWRVLSVICCVGHRR